MRWLLLLLVACTPSVTIHTNTTVVRLPVTLAVTPQEQAQGLMGVESLKGGMLFVMNDSTPYFWMKNMKIPLDFVFIKNNVVVDVVENVPPCTQNPCRIISTNHTVTYVLEVPAGFINKHHVVIGNTVRTY